MEQKKIVELARILEETMRARKQSENRISQYHYIFKVFIDYSHAQSTEYLDASLLRQCLNEHYGIIHAKEIFSRSEHYKKLVIRAYRMLCTENDGLPLVNRYVDKEPALDSQEFANAVNAFGRQHRENNYSENSIECYCRDAEQFLAFAEKSNVACFSGIDAPLIQNYILSMSGYSKVTIKHKLGAVRIFLGYLYFEKLISQDFRRIIITPRVRGQLRIPSVWTREEVLLLLDVIDRGNPSGKRDYALILMVARLGIRIGDVVAMKFEHVNWKLNQLSFVQGKTGHRIVLPLLQDVGWALIDYIQNGRPQIDSQYIFLTHTVPYKEFASQNHHHKMIEKYMTMAHIPIAQKKNGMHSLRHTLATCMMENHVSHHSISAALGHRSPDSASVYLKTSVEFLRECALTSPEVAE